MDKAKIAKALGFAAMFVIGGLAYTHVIGNEMALLLTNSITLFLPSVLAGKKAEQ